MINEGKQKKMKKLIVLGILGLFLGTGTFVTATYLMGYDNEIETIVYSDSVFSLTSDISNQVFNTTSEVVSTEQLLSFDNNNGFLDFEFTINTTKINENDITCPDFENDCVIILMNNTKGEITSNEIVKFYPGSNDFYYNVTCARFSCPQNINSDIMFVYKE